MSDYVFDLDGGRPCLDLPNTLSSSTGEHLNTYADLVAFAAQSHLITLEDANWLRREAKRDAAAAEAANGVLVRAKRLRGILYAIFSAVAAGETPSEHNIDGLNLELAATMSHTRVVPARDGEGF